MTLEDFTAHGTRPATRTSTSPEDEDLFDFPLIEMVLQKKAPPRAAATAPIAHELAPAAPLPVQAAAQTATTLAQQDAHALAPSASAPVPSTSHDAELDDLLSASPAADAAIAPDRADAANDLDHVEDAGDEDEPDVDDELPRPRRERPAKRNALAIGGSPLALLVGMLTLNLLTFGFFWYTSETFREGLQGLRDELVLASHASALARAPVDDHPPVPTNDATKPAPSTDEHASEVAIDEHVEPAPRAKPAHQLASFEQTTLDLAAQEVRDGQPMAARRRLYRLLALADRMDAGVRADVEARARFAIAESYRSQAAAKQSVGAEGGNR